MCKKYKSTSTETKLKVLGWGRGGRDHGVGRKATLKASPLPRSELVACYVLHCALHCWAGRGGVHCVVILLSNNQSIARAPYPWLLALLSVDGMKIMQLAANTLNVC